MCRSLFPCLKGFSFREERDGHEAACCTGVVRRVMLRVVISSFVMLRKRLRCRSASRQPVVSPPSTYNVVQHYVPEFF